MPRRPLTLCPPSYHEAKGEQHLLVWGELARWLVVDEELWGLLRLLNGRRRLDRALRLHARASGRPLAEVEAEAQPLMAELQGKGILRRSSRAPAPPTERLGVANVTINLTNQCNLHCNFCYNPPGKGDELPVERLMDALEQGRGILDPEASLIILGGEPTLRMDRLEQVLERAVGLFATRPMLSTNGTLLTQQNVQRLARHRLEVQVSLDSPSPQGHDVIRGKGTFHSAIQGAGRLVAAGIPTILSMVFTSRTINNFEAYLDLARNLGAREARFIPMRLMGKGADHVQDLPDLTLAFDHLVEVLQRRPELRPLLVRDFFSILKAVCGHAAARPGCGVGARVIFIDADGRVFPCPNHRQEQLCLGSLADQDLDDLVRGSVVLQELRQEYQVDNYPTCSACPFRYWCAGDCRGEALNITGDPFAPAPHCEELRLLIPRMLWLMAEEQDEVDSHTGVVHLG